jgi:hypothetical protein
MAFIGRKIYFEKTTGNLILDTGERSGDVVATTAEQDFNSYSVLKDRIPETVGIKTLEYGQFADDFNQCSGFRVNPGTLSLEFSFPDPTAPQEPIYRKPLTEEVEDLKAENADLKSRISDVEMFVADMIGGA